jgi:DNA-binding LacI/PurR family transcriptional regulator/biotin operon repressor
VAEGVFAGDRLPSVIQLAEQLGVSRETVRLALDALQRDGLLVKHRRRGTIIHDPGVPKQLLPAANTVAYLQADYSPEQGEVELITSAASSLAFHGALTEAGAAGLPMVVRSARIVKLRAAFDELCAQSRLCGVIFASVAEEKLMRRVAAMNLPAVLLDHDLHVPKLSSLRPDAFGRAKLAVEYLAGLGHRRIAIAQWHQQDLNPWHLRGYREGMRDAGLRVRREWELFVPISRPGANQVIDSIVKATQPPTAILCFNNALANFVIEAATERGLRVPEDLSVLGGGGNDVVGLTCLQLDWFDLGRQAMRMLVRAMKDGQRHVPEHKVVPYELQVGRTVATFH